MRDESSEFTEADLEAFTAQLVDRDRLSLIDRLERCGARLRELGAQVTGGAAADGEEWTAHQVLAHIAVLSKGYGVVAYRVGSGAITDLDLRAMVAQRDRAGAAVAALPIASIVAQALADQKRTLEWLRRASPEDLQRACGLGGGQSWTAATIVRLPLIAHLEQHLEQLERAVSVRV